MLVLLLQYIPSTWHKASNKMAIQGWKKGMDFPTHTCEVDGGIPPIKISYFNSRDSSSGEWPGTELRWRLKPRASTSFIFSLYSAGQLTTMRKEMPGRSASATRSEITADKVFLISSSTFCRSARLGNCEGWELPACPCEPEAGKCLVAPWSGACV